MKQPFNIQRRDSLVSKPALLLVALLLAVLTNFSIFWYGNSQMADSPDRQFMAGQANARLVVLELQIAASRHPEFDRTVLKDTIKQFNDSLLLVEKGGTFDDGHVIQPLSGTLRSEFEEVKKSWNDLAPNLQVISKASVGSPEFNQANIDVIERLQRLEAASGRFAEASEKRFFDLRTRTNTGFLLTVMLALVVLFVIIRHAFVRLFQPLRRLNDAAIQVADGNYFVALHYHFDDEIGRFASTFSQMASHVGSLVEELRDSQAFLNSVIDTLPAKICILDEQVPLLKSTANGNGTYTWVSFAPK